MAEITENTTVCIDAMIGDERIRVGAFIWKNHRPDNVRFQIWRDDSADYINVAATDVLGYLAARIYETLEQMKPPGEKL